MSGAGTVSHQFGDKGVVEISTEHLLLVFGKLHGGLLVLSRVRRERWHPEYNQTTTSSTWSYSLASALPDSRRIVELKCKGSPFTM